MRFKNSQSKSILGSENVSRARTKNFTRGIPPSEEESPFICTYWNLQHHIWLKLVQWFYREISSPNVFNMFLYGCYFLALHRSGDENKFTTTTMADIHVMTHFDQESSPAPKGVTIYGLLNIYSLLHDKGKFRNISNKHVIS